MLLMLVDRIHRLIMRSVKREILDRILHAVCDLSKIDPIYYQSYNFFLAVGYETKNLFDSFCLKFFAHGIQSNFNETIL